MNMLSPSRARLSVDVILDLVCPWCYLGTTRLLRALNRHPAIAFDLEWSPFLLNPEMSHQGAPRADYLVRKFGSHERAERLQHTIETLGKAEGIDFRFDLITRTPSSIDAHRVVALASHLGMGRAMVETLFAAHFCEGANIGDPVCLQHLGGKVGLPPAALQTLLSNHDGAEKIHAENLRAHRMGVNGVPCFILGKRHAIAGAQEVEVFERLIDMALADNNKS